MTANNVVRLDYHPRWYQRELHDNGRRFNVWVLHRRAGKTVAVINELIRDIALCQLPNPHCAYIAPLYKQAKRVAWDYVRHFLAPLQQQGIVQFRESELCALFRNGARLQLYGADNPDSLRGLYFDTVALDEVAQMSPRFWSEIIRPALADRKGRAIFIGTPMGRQNIFHRLFEHAGKEEEQETWHRALLTVDDTGIIDDEELHQARGTMLEAEYQQEFLCSWDAAVRGAIFADEMGRAEREGRIGVFPRDGAAPCITAWDLGRRNYTVVGTFQAIGDTLTCVACRAYEFTSIPDIASDLRTHQPWSYSVHIAPHDAGNGELGHDQTRAEVAAEHGIQWTILPRRPREEGIDAVRRIFPRLRFNVADEGVRQLVEAMRLYRTDKDDRLGGVNRVEPVKDWTTDYADMVRYFAAHVAGQTNPAQGMAGWSQQELAWADDELARVAI